MRAVFLHYILDATHAPTGAAILRHRRSRRVVPAPRVRQCSMAAFTQEVVVICFRPGGAFDRQFRTGSKGPASCMSHLAWDGLCPQPPTHLRVCPGVRVEKILPGARGHGPGIDWDFLTPGPAVVAGMAAGTLYGKPLPCRAGGAATAWLSTSTSTPFTPVC